MDPDVWTDGLRCGLCMRFIEAWDLLILRKVEEFRPATQVWVLRQAHQAGIEANMDSQVICCALCEKRTQAPALEPRQG